MHIYLIGYDLNGKGKNYESLIEEIKGLSGSWWHHLDSTWLIKHSGPATSIRDALASHLDKDDELLVVRLNGEGAWTGFNAKGSKWLKDNL